MWSMQLAYPPFQAGEHPKATRRMGNKNANSIFSKSRRQLKSPEPKIGVRAAKSRLSRAELGPWEEAERKCHGANSLAAGSGPAPADIRERAK